MDDVQKEKQRVIDDEKESGADDANSGKNIDSSDVYRQRRFRPSSPKRPINTAEGTNYAEVMRERQIERESVEVARIIQNNSASTSTAGPSRQRRWDMPTPETSADEAGKFQRSEWDSEALAGSVAQTPRASRRWDATPVGHQEAATIAETPKRVKTRWDETPVNTGTTATATPSRSSFEESNFVDSANFFPRSMATDPEQALAVRWQRELEVRNRYMNDDEINDLLPLEGYAILEAPTNYVPVTPSRKLTATPSASDGNSMSGFSIASTDNILRAVSASAMTLQPPDEDLPPIKAEDYQYFSSLLKKANVEEMSIEDAKARKILKLLLRIKSGTPQMRRQSLRQISEKAQEFGANALFEAILPLLMSPTLEPSERHVLVKAIDRIMLKLGDSVRPFAHKIIVVISPLLIEEDYYARVEGREVITNLAKAAGLATMIATLRPDIDHADEFVRNTTARTFAVVASALGIPALLPFLKAVCKSKKSWLARHTGIRIVQQVAILFGHGVLPYLRPLVECVVPGMDDEQFKIRTMTSLAVSALAEASSPHGIEAFEPILKPMWQSLRHLRGKALAAALKAMGHLVALMKDPEQIDHYVKELIPILLKEFNTPDDEEKRIVLKVLQQCTSKDALSPQYIRTEVFSEFFRSFWTRRLVADRRSTRLLIDVTIDIAGRIGISDIVGRLTSLLKDDLEVLRRAALETISRICKNFGSSNISSSLESQLVDGLLFAFQEHALDDPHGVIVGFIGAIFSSLGTRMKPYLVQISSMILWRLANRTAKIRQYAADLVSQLAPIIAQCQEEILLAKVGVVLYENLGEEYPDVLASILGALKSILKSIGSNRMKPPPKDLLPRLTPILRNRNDRVQENCIELVGSLADLSAEAVSPREWMRICFELLDMLKTPRKSTRRLAIVTFGYIAKAVGPHDVLAALLNNLKVQERTNRVATTLAIAIVAENCAPFTILPALMNEYRVPEMNVQNGVLKSISFMCEYIGELVKDYIYAITPMLDDALQDRDQVHRQTAAMAVKHMALGAFGFGCEDALVHLINAILPNLFDINPHLVVAVIESIDAVRLAVSPSTVFYYLVQGLFHPARRVRDIYWRLYNNLYIASQDALVIAYPLLPDEGDLHMHRNLMNIMSSNNSWSVRQDALKLRVNTSMGKFADNFAAALNTIEGRGGHKNEAVAKLDYSCAAYSENMKIAMHELLDLVAEIKFYSLVKDEAAVSQ